MREITGGWIKLYRDIQEHWIWQDAEKLKWWLDILLLANHQDNKFLLGNELLEVKRGEHHTSELKLAERWGVSKTTVRRFLNLLEKDAMIELKKSKKGTTLKVSNYNGFQGFSETEKTTKEPQVNHKETIDEPQKNHTVYTNKNERMKECKNDNKEESTSSEFEPLITSWNNLNLSKIISIKNNRLKMLNARIKESGIDEVIRAINNINESGFLRGQNDRNWTITFDWFVKPNNFIKVLEGNYKDKEKENKVQARTSKGNFTNYEQRKYDFDDLEKKLLGWSE